MCRKSGANGNKHLAKNVGLLWNGSTEVLIGAEGQGVNAPGKRAKGQVSLCQRCAAQRKILAIESTAALVFGLPTTAGDMNKTEVVPGEDSIKLHSGVRRYKCVESDALCSRPWKRQTLERSIARVAAFNRR